MTALLNFVLGGGLLALVQAILTAWNTVQAKQNGAATANLAVATKVADDAKTGAEIDSQVATMSSADVASELQQFTRD